jgi:hypothetical protein
MNTNQVEVKLNKQEIEMLASLPEALRPQVEASLLAAKRESVASVVAARTVFSVSLSETVKDKDGKLQPGKGGFKVTGLGSRFPVTLYPEQWEILFANAEAIRACYNDPANKAKSDALRRA